MEGARSQPIYFKSNNLISDSVCKEAPPSVSICSSDPKIRDKTVSSNVYPNTRIKKVENTRDSNRLKPKLFLTDVSCQKERWRSETYYRSTRPEQICSNKTVSPNLTKLCSGLLATGRLANQNRPVTSILSHTNSPITQTLSTSELYGRGLADDLPAIRPFLSTAAVCRNHLLGRGDPTQERLSSSSISRRLPPSSSGQDCTVPTGRGGRGTPESTWMAGQLQEIYPHSDSQYRISRDTVADSQEHQVFTHKKTPEHLSGLRQVDKAGGVQTPSTTATLGPSELCLHGGREGSSSLPPFTNTSPSISKRPSEGCLYTACGFEGNAVVARNHKYCNSSNSLTQSEPLSKHRCFRHGLGSPIRPNPTRRFLEQTSTKLAQQQEGNVCSVFSHKTPCPQIKRFPCPSTVRQSYSGCVHTQRGGNSVNRVAGNDLSVVSSARSMECDTISSLPSGKVQSDSRPVIKEATYSRVASPASGNLRNLRAMGISDHRSICIEAISCCPKVRHYRRKRSWGRIHRRLQSRLGLPPGMGLPASQLDTTRPGTSQQSTGDVFTSHTRLGTSVLETRSGNASLRTSAINYKSPESIDRLNDGPPPTMPTTANIASLEGWGWGQRIASWTDEQKELLAGCWRQSTINTYLPALNRWVVWCTKYTLDARKPKPEDVAKFLAETFLTEGLSYRTILLHKSAVSTYCGQDEKTFSHFLVKNVLRAIQNAKPSSHKCPIWDPRQVFDWLINNNGKSTLFEAARRSATILLLASGRRLHDLTLLRFSDSQYQDSGDSIRLWPSYGSKTDKGSKRQPGWELKKHEIANICPVTWIRRYIEESKYRREQNISTNSLFITLRGEAKAATKTMIGGWVRSVLRDAGIEASPGSCRPAVASLAWLENRSIEEILDRGNWRCENTFKKYYCREIETQARDQIDNCNLFNNFSNI